MATKGVVLSACDPLDSFGAGTAPLIRENPGTRLRDFGFSFSVATMNDGYDEKELPGYMLISCINRRYR